MTISTRNYIENKEYKSKKYNVFFRDEFNKTFYRVIIAPSSDKAVAYAMQEDRRMGGGLIEYLHFFEEDLY